MSRNLKTFKIAKINPKIIHQAIQIGIIANIKKWTIPFKSITVKNRLVSLENQNKKKNLKKITVGHFLSYRRILQ